MVCVLTRVCKGGIRGVVSMACEIESANRPRRRMYKGSGLEWTIIYERRLAMGALLRRRYTEELTHHHRRLGILPLN